MEIKLFDYQKEMLKHFHNVKFARQIGYWTLFKMWLNKDKTN